ncbi:MAG TPA: OsmC family protein [Anaerolineales bacterium]|nr:OsmC family protein [Anaerolineales bacterium]
MKLEITFQGGAQVDAAFAGFRVHTDQPPEDGGEGAAPTPFAHFLASMGTCAGAYVLSYLRKKNLPTQGVRLVQRVHGNRQTGMVEAMDIEILVPEDFPKKYLPALVRSAELCSVKKHLEHPPSVSVSAKAVA